MGDPSNGTDPTGLVPCPSVPKHRNGANIDANIKSASKRIADGFLSKYWWFYKMVKTGGLWDYKRQGPRGLFEDFGNFNYGATGYTLGISDEVLLRAAGDYQIKSGTSDFDYIFPLGLGGGPVMPYQFPMVLPPYGDDPKDQKMIMRGILYATNQCKCH